jgi:hypothetical protein
MAVGNVLADRQRALRHRSQTPRNVVILKLHVSRFAADADLGFVSQKI